MRSGPAFQSPPGSDLSSPRSFVTFLNKSTSDHVNHREHRNPDRVDKMPIPRDQFQALSMLRPHASEQEQNQRQRKEGQADDHVTGVEADQRIKGRAEEIGADRQARPGDQMAPLHGSKRQKEGAEDYRAGPPESEAACVRTLEGALSQYDRQAAREQTDGGYDRRFQHLRRIGAAETLADIV